MAASTELNSFIARWAGSGAAERANYQLFLTELAHKDIREPLQFVWQTLFALDRGLSAAKVTRDFPNGGATFVLLPSRNYGSGCQVSFAFHKILIRINSYA